MSGLQGRFRRYVGELGRWFTIVEGDDAARLLDDATLVGAEERAGEGVDGAPVDTWLVLGEVVAVHIDQALLKDGVYDTANAGHILRGGGPADYFTVGPEQLFRMYRPR